MKIKSHDAAILSYIAKLASLNRTAAIQHLIDANVARLSEEIRHLGSAIADSNSEPHPVVAAYRAWAAKRNEDPMFAR